MHRLLFAAAIALAACTAAPVDTTPIPRPPQTTPLSIVLFPSGDLDPAESYTLGACDKLVVRVADIEKPGLASSYEIEVGPAGEIELPLAGDFDARGLTARQLRDRLKDALKEFLVDPRVSVRIAKHHSKQVTVSGQVNAPAKHSFPRNRIRIADAIALAKGLGRDAGTTAYLVRRTDKGIEQYRIDLLKLQASDFDAELRVQPGDRVHVPKADRVFVTGYVERPGAYPLTRELTAYQLVEEAGGWLDGQASPTRAFIRQRQADGSYRIIKIDLEAIRENEARDHVIGAGDSVVVPQSTLRAIFRRTRDEGIKRVPGPQMFLGG